jgi:RimJ/RimL family protein N-acetyltransferase
MPWLPIALEGRHVRLEPLTRDHAEELWEASRDERTWRWLSISRPATHTALERWLDEALAAAANGSEIPFATLRVVPGADPVVVGSTRFLALRPEHRSVEIGWTWLHPAAWGTGVNAEAKLLQLDHAFGTWRCRRVEWKTDALNERSRRAIEALGATFEGVHRQHMLVRGGESRDSAWYSLLADEWPGARERLVSRLARV